MSWLDFLFWPREGLSDMQADIASIRVTLLQMTTRRDLHALEARMSDRENAAYEKLTADIQTVKDGWASLVAERDALKTALETADADAAAQVQAALDADSDVDAAKVEAADAALAGLVAPPAPAPEPAPVTPEPAPVDPAPEPAPVDPAPADPEA